MLDRVADLPHPPLWVACPDVVGDSAATLSQLDEWCPVIVARGLPVALVTQDGLTPDRVPWGRIAALFLGGSDAHKLGPEAGDLARAAKTRGLWVHAGRVQTLVKIRRMVSIGVDSIDGTCTAVKPRFWVPKLLSWIARAEHELRHPALF